MKLDSGKYTKFSSDEIKQYLIHLKRLVSEGKYTISSNPNRQENKDFILEYRINSNKEKEILLTLQVTDFCYAADNWKQGYEHEKVYVFCKEYELDHWGDAEIVEIYIKTNSTQTKSSEDFMVIISFHKLNRPIKYLFK